MLPYLLIQMALGFPLLEVVNYLEHYGLLRRKRSRVMDRRLIAHYGGDVTRANIHPRARRRLQARYGPAG